MASLKYLDPITGEYKKVASGGGGTSIPASDTEPATGNYWLDTSEEGGTYYTAGEVDNMLAALPAGLTMDLLWENPDPTAEFAAQKIELDLSIYDLVMIAFRHSTSEKSGSQSLASVGGAFTSRAISVNASSKVIYARSYTAISTGVSFNSAYVYETGTTSTAGLIPAQIYGIKSTVTGGTPVTPENVYTKDEIDELLASVGGGVGLELLWENENLEVEFAAQKISVDIGEDLTTVIVFADLGAKWFIGNGAGRANVTYYAGGSPQVRNRTFTIESDGITFADAEWWKTSGTITKEINNNYVKPLAIYKVKSASNSASEIEDPDHPGCFYRTVNGVQEWLNPPMELGVEYKTTERYLGKPVYVKLVDLGAFPASGTKDVSIGVTTASIHEVRGFTSNKVTVPWHRSETDWADLGTVFGYKVRMAVGKDLSSLTVTAFVKYTKTTD